MEALKALGATPYDLVRDAVFTAVLTYYGNRLVKVERSVRSMWEILSKLVDPKEGLPAKVIHLEEKLKEWQTPRGTRTTTKY